MTFLAAAVQLNCSSDRDRNWSAAQDLIRQAAGYGARVVATPENTNFQGTHPEKVRLSETLDGPTCRRFSELARELGIYLLLGSFNETAPVPQRCYNTSVLFSPGGVRLGVYRKIHLFDVSLSPELTFRESEAVAAGTQVVSIGTELAHFGLSICYDLRFSELYTRLTGQGANLITIPAAFTATTGKAHWTVLIRARAIETQSFVIAPAQTGRHDEGGLRHSHGHSMIVDPWGTVLAQAGEEPGLALAQIDLSEVERIRSSMPVQEHRRLPEPA